MNALEQVALGKAIAEATKGMTVAPGEYAVDFTATVRVVGTMKKGKDVAYTPTVSIPLKEALALALHYAGCTREAAKAVMIQAMTAALNGEAATIGDCIPDVEEAMKHVQQVTEALPKQTRAGALTSKLVALVGPEQEPLTSANKLTDPRSNKAEPVAVAV